jgi:hypothetical protein
MVRIRNLLIFFIVSFWLKLDVSAQVSFCKSGGGYPNALSGMPNSFMNNNGPFLVRIFIHAVRNSSGTNGVTQAQITQALNTITGDFANHNICFSLVGTDNINNDDFINYNDACGGSDDDFNQLIATNVTDNAIDIYLLPDNVYNAGLASGIPGRALVIGGSLNFNGTTTVLSTSHVLSHELGHCLGLFHTFHGTFSGEGNGVVLCDGTTITACAELVDGTNGATCGDFVQDSPADPIQLFNQSLGSACTWDNTTIRDANNQLFNPDETLIMSYTFPQCMQIFTAGQGLRMRNTIFNSPILQARTVPQNVFVQNRTLSSGNILFASLGSITVGSNVTTGTQGSVSFTNTTVGELRGRT